MTLRILIWGSRSLTWKHLPVFRALALHAMLDDTDSPLPDLASWIPSVADQTPDAFRLVTTAQSLTLLNGDGPPGRERGAIGADKLAVLACMEMWAASQRRMRWFPPYMKDGETWAQAAHRRNIEMAEAHPDRSYCIHTDLDSSKGSIITARALHERGLPFWYVKVTQAGAVLSAEERRP